MEARVTVRDVRAEEFADLGRLLVEVYSSLPGFPSPLEQPAYYDMLRIIGEFTKKPGVSPSGVPQPERRQGTCHCVHCAGARTRPYEVVLHTTKAMQTAWGMYERLGFSRSPDLDFLQKDLPVFGFRLSLR
jgi:hypothetical protein